MKAKDSSSGFIAGITKSILANKVALFFCWIGVMALFCVIILHKGYQEWWFWPVIILLGAVIAVIVVWYLIKDNEKHPFQSTLGWLSVLAIPATIIAIVVLGYYLIVLLIKVWYLLVEGFYYAVNFMKDNPQWALVIFVIGITLFILSLLAFIMNSMRRIAP